MTARYFQGDSVTGHVKASSARDFKEVVERLKLCPNLPLSKAAFLALPRAQRNEVKKVPYLVPAVFQTSPSPRTYDRATHCNLIFLDLDDAKDAAPIARNPQILFDRLAGFSFAAHTTASSTPEKPRLRVIVDAEAIPLDDYPRAVATIAMHLGVATNSESRVAVQPMFLPTLFADSADTEHPLIAAYTDGSRFTVDDISETLPEENKPPRADRGNVCDDLFFLRAPVPEITLALAKEALEKIDPDCDYNDWRECASALKHQFSPHKAEEAYELFDSWSSGGSKYGGEAETRAKWDSFRQTPIGRAPITIRTLLKKAAAAGWDDRKVKDNGFQTVIRWMDTVETVTELLDKSAHKILATPMLTAVQEDMLVHHLVKSAKKRFSQPVSASAIRKDIKATKRLIREQENPPETKEPPWARGVAFVSTAGEFFRHRTGEKYRPEAFNANYSRFLLPTEESLKADGVPVTPASLSKPTILPVDFTLNHLKIPTVYDYAYDPSQPNEVFFVNEGRKYVNIYSPTFPEPDRSRADEIGGMFFSHIQTLIAEAAYQIYLTDWLAYHVQFPGRKIRYAIALQGVEGCGKTYISEAEKAVLGPQHVKVIDCGAIHSGFNEWAFGKQLVVVEEIRVAGINRYEVMNALKPLITNDEISVNEKFRNNRQTVNISNFLLFTNHHDALALTPGDRRYCVIKSRMQHKDQVRALGENYFPPLFRMLRDYPGALRAWFEDYSISPDFNPDGHAPRTIYLNDMVNDSATDLQAAVRRLLIEADYPLVQFDLVSAKVLNDVLLMDEGLHKVTGQQLAHVLRDEGLVQAGRHVIGEERHYLWCRPGVKDPAALAAERVKSGAKNLGMDLIYG